MGKKGDAKRLFEEQLSTYPNSAEVPNAIYWLGRMAESEGDKKLARAYYQKLADNYRYFYYANLARGRMAGVGDEVVDPPLLESLPRPVSASERLGTASRQCTRPEGPAAGECRAL